MAGAYSMLALSDPFAPPRHYNRRFLYVIMRFAFQICMRNIAALIARRTSRAYVSSASSVPNSTFACRWVDRSDDHFESRDSLASLFSFFSAFPLPCSFSSHARFFSPPFLNILFFLYFLYTFDHIRFCVCSFVFHVCFSPISPLSFFSCTLFTNL